MMFMCSSYFLRALKAILAIQDQQESLETGERSDLLDLTVLWGLLEQKDLQVVLLK